MKKFTVLYFAPAELMGKMSTSTPEEKAKGMEAWMNWKANNEENVINFGAPLMPAQKTDASGNWSQSTSEVTGFSVMQAESADDLKARLADHPHIHWGEGCTIEVHEHIAMG